jgi:hypothetical protein
MLRSSLAGLLALAAAAHADLVWEKQVQEFHVTPEDKAVEARFAFKNTGPETINIKRVQSSCGCTTAKPSKTSFAPGESGEIEVKFSFGSRRGAHQKTIAVQSDDKREWKAVLRCWIHEPLTISPMLVYWKVGDDPQTRSVTLTAAKGEQVHVKGVKASSPRFSASVQTVKDGDSYTVSVTPSKTTEKDSAEVTVDTDYPPSAPRSYRFFARIK